MFDKVVEDTRGSSCIGICVDFKLNLFPSLCNDPFTRLVFDLILASQSLVACVLIDVKSIELFSASGAASLKYQV
jgi:hypothetical protein